MPPTEAAPTTRVKRKSPPTPAITVNWNGQCVHNVTQAPGEAIMRQRNSPGGNISLPKFIIVFN